MIALSSDAHVLNPIIATGSNTSTVLQFLFPDLVDHEFDASTGMDSMAPSVAVSWSWSDDRTKLTYVLRGDLQWSDSMPLTSHDIKFSYQLMADPEVPAVRRGKLRRLLHGPDGKVDWDRAIVTPDDSTIQFYFETVYRREHQLDDTQMHFVPQHYFKAVETSRVASSDFNTKPVTANSYRLFSWSPRQEIVLERDPLWFRQGQLDRFIFRILPDMTTRLVELKTGAVDVVEGLTPEQASDVSAHGDIRIERQQHRRLEYVGWSNIDQHALNQDGSIRAHPLFGDAGVRRALTLAIDRSSLAAAALGGYGEMALGPVSPAFKWAYNDTLQQLEYDPEEALRLLKLSGWTDGDGDGTLDRGGLRFEFTLTINSGNDRRAFAAERIRADLKKIGVHVRTQSLESNAFNTGLRARSFDAFIAGHVVNLGVELENQFGSDLQRNVFNVVGFRDGRVDSLLDAAAGHWRLADGADEVRRIQCILHDEQPMTFLYWYDNLIAFRNRVKGTNVSILSPYHRFFEWYVEE